MSQGTCDLCKHGAWICSSTSRGLVLLGVSWPRHGGWAGGVSSARCHHGHQLCQISHCLSLWAKRYPHFPSTCTCKERRKPNLCTVGLYLRWTALEPGFVLDGKERAGWISRSAHCKDEETMNKHIVFAACILLKPLFLGISVRTREIAKLLVRSVSLMTHQVLQSQNRLLVLERYKTCHFYGYCTKHCIYACKRTF